MADTGRSIARVIKKVVVALLAMALLATIVVVGLLENQRATPWTAAKAVADERTQKCLDCHEQKRVAMDWIRQWSQSRHALKGVGCIACHEAKADDPDKWDHETFILTQVPSPKDCVACHEKEVREFEDSHHAKAAQFIGSLDNILGEVVEGAPAANMGCRQCHGSEVRVDSKGIPIVGTWPNTGIGRVNPDKSLGTCTACHTRHMFSKQQAREPGACGRCHMGPDHPQKEIYEESKHGIMFAAWREKMDLGADKWVVGQTYTAAPVCVTCHMAATTSQPSSHDIGLRIAWTLRPLISKRQENWEVKRSRMISVCQECHGKTWVLSYFKMYDDAVDLWNGKFATPAGNIMDALKTANKITPTPFDDSIEWTFYELWHHEGRRARMGASMMGPDFTQWHGFYEVAKHFYTKFLPEAEALLPGVSQTTLRMPVHAWKTSTTPEQIKQVLDFYQQHYGQKVQ